MPSPHISENGVHLLPGPLERCPQCDRPDLETVSDGDITNFFCQSCLACWHLELGFVHRVDPTTCGGCAHLPTCLLKLATEQAAEERT